MLYLWPQSTPPAASHYGLIVTPAKESIPAGVRAGRPWAMDNEAFTRGFDPARFFPFLERFIPYRATCLFVAVPDVVGDAISTGHLYRQWVRHFEGWPVAFVAQDGQEDLPLPPSDWVFIGGSTAWKMGPGALQVIRRARANGQRVHVGRVNSQRRIYHFRMAGADSVDGTGPAYEPDNYERLFNRALAQRTFIL